MATAICALSTLFIGRNGLTTLRQGPLGLLLFLFFLASAPFARALPVDISTINPLKHEELPKGPDDPSLWVYLGTACVLVLAGGAFAGLTIAYATLIPSRRLPTDVSQLDGPR